MPVNTARVISSSPSGGENKYVARTVVEVVAVGANSYTITAGALGAADSSGHIPDFSNIPTGTTAANTTLGSIFFNVSSQSATAHVDIVWRGTTDETVLSLSNSGDWNFVPEDGGGLGLPNKATGATGNVFINPVGFAAGDAYSVILELFYP